MKTQLLAAGVAATAMILAAPQVLASGYKPYLSVFGGAAFLTKNPHISTSSQTTSFDLLMNNPGYIIGGTVGVDWGNQIRTELELSHAHWNSDKYHHSSSDGIGGTNNNNSDVSASYLLGNAWLDLNQGSRITPYVGGGLGIGWANVNAFTELLGGGYHFNASGLAFQIGAGVRFNVNEHVVIDAGYRFKDIVGLNYAAASNGDVLTDTSLASHNFQIGLTYQF
jgi:opacity protein-like surface antigen